MGKTSLASLCPGQRGTVLENGCEPMLAARLEDMGLTLGLEVSCLHRSPAGSPAAYEICGAAIALRREDAARILVEARDL